MKVWKYHMNHRWKNCILFVKVVNMFKGWNIMPLKKIWITVHIGKWQGFTKQSDQKNSWWSDISKIDVDDKAVTDWKHIQTQNVGSHPLWDSCWKHSSSKNSLLIYVKFKEPLKQSKTFIPTWYCNNPEDLKLRLQELGRILHVTSTFKFIILITANHKNIELLSKFMNTLQIDHHTTKL
jgi:hypothetical protein